MTHTWEEYQKAKEVVKTFLKEKRIEQAGRTYLQPLSIKILLKQIEISEIQYRLSKMSKEKKEKLDFLDTYLQSLKNDMLKMKKKTFFLANNLFRLMFTYIFIL